MRGVWELPSEVSFNTTAGATGGMISSCAAVIVDCAGAQSRSSNSWLEGILDITASDLFVLMGLLGGCSARGEATVTCGDTLLDITGWWWMLPTTHYSIIKVGWGILSNVRRYQARVVSTTSTTGTSSGEVVFATTPRNAACFSSRVVSRHTRPCFGGCGGKFRGVSFTRCMWNSPNLSNL